MASSLNKIRTGSFVGSGADRKVVLGFKPKKVEIYNTTDGVDYHKSESMNADNKARKEISDGTKTFVAAATIDADGFTFIAAENVDAKVFHYVAYQSESE
jgi:hypothetical protein